MMCCVQPTTSRTPKPRSHSLDSSLLLVPAQARRLDVCCVTHTNHSPIVGYFLFYLVKVGVNSDDFLCRSWFDFPFQNSFLTGPLFTSILEQCVHFSRKRWRLTFKLCELMFLVCIKWPFVPLSPVALHKQYSVICAPSFIVLYRILIHSGFYWSTKLLDKQEEGKCQHTACLTYPFTTKV